MPRKPAHIELVGGKGPRQRVWEAIRRLADLPAGVFTEKMVWHETEGFETDVDTETVRDYRRGLVAAGYLELVKKATHREPATYRLARDNGSEAPRVRRDGTAVTQGLAQEQMWRTLRQLKGDTNGRELAAHASTPAIPVAEVAARDYLLNLHNAGYLARTKEGRVTGRNVSRTQARYRLVKNTGPRPPMVCRTNCLYDPNIGEIVRVEPVTDEDAIYGR